LELGLIGFPGSGKSTLFRAITEIAEQNTGSRWGKAQVGVVKVPDPRLDALAAIFHPKKFTPAELRLIDFPPLGESGVKQTGITGELLSMLQRVDALVHVVRAFDGAVHQQGGLVSPERAVTEMDAELAFADLAILERRIKRVDDSMKSAKTADRGKMQQEKEFLARMKSALESDVPVHRQELSDEERLTLRNFQLLTSKPVLVVLNVGEGTIGSVSQQTLEAVRKATGQKVVAVCAKLEEELGAMAPAEREEFRKDMGVPEASRDTMVRESFTLLNTICFLTAGEDEVRAWPIERGTVAVKAAGKVHSDIERGFIRAEVIDWKQLVECKGYAEAKKRGLMRSEGKTYVVQDGDVINYLFNV
jgi:GTP-binding protein YchF